MNKTISNLVILGSTGSIGQQALEVVDQHPDKFKVVGLAAGNNVSVLAQQISKYNPVAVAIGDERYYHQLKDMVGDQVQIMAGLKGLTDLAGMECADTVLIAVSGAVGIKPTIEAIKSNKRIALANKETLVAAGDIVMELAREHNSAIIPVDSEHSAIFQCLSGEERFLQKIWLTASGGPFKDYSQEQLEQVTVDMALKHPNWKMGPKITIDSATLMNKGLEVIEAHHLFAASYEDIEVIIQKESVIHSMVELVDGSFIAHLGVADMRIPIQYALTYPERYNSPAAHLDFGQLTSIHFSRPDTKRFKALDLAYQAGKMGGTMPAVMNAANEIAVNNFLRGKIKFFHITRLVEEVMLKHSTTFSPDLETIIQSDKWSRTTCTNLIEKGVE